MTRREAAQLSILDRAPAVQKRRPVDADTYAAIGLLRSAGKTVYAAGDQHRVDGRLLDTDQLRRLAAAYKPILGAR